MRVVAFGGGTGLRALLEALRDSGWEVTAVVSVMDSGGSSGRLRRELGILPPGDVRQCLLALAPEGPLPDLFPRLWDYRFPRGEGLAGHPLGNLLLAALTEITGDFARAVEAMGRLLGVRGRVLPVTLDATHLFARLEDGRLLEGEAAIDTYAARSAPSRIVRLYLDPPARVYPPVREAVAGADLVLFGPGDLYTSLLPHLRVEGVREAVVGSGARKGMVVNLMTKPGETDGFRASDFLRVLAEELGVGALDLAVVNTARPAPEVEARYREAGQEPVEADLEACRRYARRVVACPLLAEGSPVRHSPRALREALASLGS